MLFIRLLKQIHLAYHIDEKNYILYCIKVKTKTLLSLLPEEC